MPTAGSLPLILIPGMGADARLLAAQKAVFPQLIVPEWLPPALGETLSAYAQRLATQLNLEGPCLVGGVSFGGMLAVEMSRHLDAQACLLIASIRSPQELPKWIRRIRPLVRLIPGPVAELPRFVAWLLLILLGWSLRPGMRSLLEQFVRIKGRFLKWACLAIMDWEMTSPPGVPVLQIHGDRDHVLRHDLTRPDELIPGAGHLLPMTHPEAVNAFLRRHIQRFDGR